MYTCIMQHNSYVTTVQHVMHVWCAGWQDIK